MIDSNLKLTLAVGNDFFERSIWRYSSIYWSLNYFNYTILFWFWSFFEIERFDLYRGEICEPRSGSGGVIRFLERYVIVLMCDSVQNSCFLIIACQGLTIKIRKVFFWGSGLTNAGGWSLSRSFNIMFPYSELSEFFT